MYFLEMDILNISQIIPLPIQCAEVCGGIFKTPTLLQMHNGIELSRGKSKTYDCVFYSVPSSWV